MPTGYTRMPLDMSSEHVVHMITIITEFVWVNYPTTNKTNPKVAQGLDESLSSLLSQLWKNYLSQPSIILKQFAANIPSHTKDEKNQKNYLLWNINIRYSLNYTHLDPAPPARGSLTLKKIESK